MTPRLPSKAAGRTVSRRQFLQTAGTVLAGSVLAACAGTEQRTLFEAEALGTATPERAFSSPVAPGPEPTAALDLARFLAFSAALTGVANLDPRLGQVYWESLQGTGQQQAVIDLLDRAGVTETGGEASVDAIQAAGLFDDPAARQLVGEITKLWYTGVYMRAGEPAVATFTDALSWKMLRFTKPNTVCASFGFWAVQPLTDVSRSAEPVAPAVPSEET